MSYRPYITTKSATKKDALEDAIEQSGSAAKIIRIDWKDRVIHISGSYVDTLLFRCAVKQAGFSVVVE